MSYKIHHDKPECISCGACAATTPEFWVMEEDLEGKSHLIGSKKAGESEELEVTEKNLQKNKEAAEVCPVNCIHLYNGDKKLI